MALQVKDGNGALVNTPAFDKAYSAAVTTFSPAITTSATDCQLLVLAGVAGVVARLKRLVMVPKLTTLALGDFRLERWSTAGTLGSAALTAIPTQARHGSPNAPGSAPAAPSLVVSTVGTAAYTTAGTTAGIFYQQRLSVQALAAAATPFIGWDLNYSNKLDQAPEICGVTDLIVLISKPTATATGAIFDLHVQWEEATI